MISKYYSNSKIGFVIGEIEHVDKYNVSNEKTE
jgi:hypothetical protein